MIRTYYYDGIADSKYAPETYAKQREYFESLEKDNQNIEVVLDEAVKTSEGIFRQKGVDIRLAIDAIAMAYQDAYESGLFLLGDRDFIPLIESVKNAGKKTFGFFARAHLSRNSQYLAKRLHVVDCQPAK